MPTAGAKAADVLRLSGEGMSGGAIAKSLGISRASAYRLIAEIRSPARHTA